jgi:hypothetical protein
MSSDGEDTRKVGDGESPGDTRGRRSVWRSRASINFIFPADKLYLPTLPQITHTKRTCIVRAPRHIHGHKNKTHG